MSSIERKTIVVLIALAEEYEIFAEIFPSSTDVSCERCVCLEHDSGRPDLRLISILSEQMGALSAGNSADLAIREFDPDLVVVLGIAGGVSSDLTLGDVCISNEILDVLHNNKVSEKDGISDISFAPHFYSVDAELVSTFAFLRIHPVLKTTYEDWKVLCGVEAERLALGGGGVALPGVQIGPIACGPVSASPQFNAKLKSLHRKVMAIETESGGVFERLANAQRPAIAIRGISDLADADKGLLEHRTKGAARRLAMFNATTLLRAQLSNPRFLDVAARHAERRGQEQGRLFPGPNVAVSIVAELEREAKARLKELSADFRSRPNGFYLPIPRARRISYTDELAGRELQEPENIIDCLRAHDRTIIRLPRTFPSQALGWSLAYSLLRQELDGKIVLPFVVSGNSIRPPKSGLRSAIPEGMRERAFDPEFVQVFIIEEPCFESRSRLKYLTDEIAGTSAKVMVITKSEDNVATVDGFVRENLLVEFELAPISFSETAFFLERTFDMNPREAEAIAIRLDDTFRKFRLDAHPTYFAGLQEETLAALINANKRAELIQLAVDGLLTLIVAADHSKPNLSRTTRERFLRRLVLEMAISEGGVDDERLAEMASDFLKEHAFEVGQAEFLNPFFQMGLLYKAGGIINFTHPYLESYLLAQALREQPDCAKDYFDPTHVSFNYYAFDLYCEMGPDARVIAEIKSFADRVLSGAQAVYSNEHIYLEKGRHLTTLSTGKQLAGLTQGLVSTAQKLERPDTDDDVRADKQRILDNKRYVVSEVGNRTPGQAADLPAEIKEEFEILDGLNRALALCSTGVGSGSESLDGVAKRELAQLVLVLGGKFSDIWTRNRLRIDFDQVRLDLLSDERVWKYVEESGADHSDFNSIKSELEMFLHGAEINTILEHSAT